MAELRKCHCCGTVTDKDVCPRCYVSVVNDGIKLAEEPKEESAPVTTKTRKTRKEV